MGLLDDTRNFMQGASNSVTGMVSAPVDGISWALRKAGLGNVIGNAPVGGSDWMQAQGLLRAAPGKAGLLGESLGGVLPIVAQAKAAQIAAGALKVGANFAAPATMNPQMGAVVYHGSPHSFDKFDMSKIGTGEGAQAYGHGLYFADAPATARTYATDRSYVGRTMAGVPDNTKFDAPWIAQSAVDTHGEDAASHLATVLRANASNNPAQMAANKEVQDALALVQGGQVKPSGNLYKVDLPDEHIAKMLDWDKPLSQQPEALAGVRAFAAHPDMPPGFSQAVESALQRKFDGQDLYTEAFKVHKSAPDVAQRMRAAGIPGIRYLDQGSRGAGGGTSNYVVFDDALPKILERNGTSLGF